jgi:hypothetical protein
MKSSVTKRTTKMSAFFRRMSVPSRDAVSVRPEIVTCTRFLMLRWQFEKEWYRSAYKLLFDSKAWLHDGSGLINR